MPPRTSAAPLVSTADPVAAGLEALFEKVAADFSAPLIANIVGISAANTHTKLTRIRHLLAAQVGAGDKR